MSESKPDMQGAHLREEEISPLRLPALLSCPCGFSVAQNVDNAAGAFFFLNVSASVRDVLPSSAAVQGMGQPLLASDKKVAMLEKFASPSKSMSKANSGERRSSNNLIKAIH